MVPPLLFVLGLIGLTAIGIITVLMTRSRVRVTAVSIAQRGLIRTRRWEISEVGRICRGNQYTASWSAPLEFVYLLDHDGQCLTRLETSAWWPGDSADRIAKAIGQPVYIPPPYVTALRGARPWWTIHPWWFTVVLLVPVTIVGYIGIVLAERLGLSTHG
jgi:hypothetical protein